MPARSSRHNNAPSNKEKSNVQVQRSPRPSPRTHLPTPLPEEERISSASPNMRGPVVPGPLDYNNSTLDVLDDQLIDFDTPTPPPQRPIYLPLSDHTLDVDLLHPEDEEDDILGQTYRSPPFREAHLPAIDPDEDRTPSPLPIPPRGMEYQQDIIYNDQPSYDADVDSSGASSLNGGHTRWPTYSRSNTHNAPPSILNPLFTSTAYSTPPPNLHISTQSRTLSHSPSPYTSHQIPPHVRSSQTPSKFHSLTMDVIEWARWDVLDDRRVLILAYPAGLQIWDCSDLSAISEILNLNFDSAEWSMVFGCGGTSSTERLDEGTVVQVVHVALLPAPREAHPGMKDPLSRDRPLLGILMQTDYNEDCQNEKSESSFVLYSLRTHQLVKRLPLSGMPSTFTANDQFIIISMISPPSLVILSSATFHTLHIYPSASLELFSPVPQYSTTTPTTSSSTLGSLSTQPLSISNAVLSTAQSAIASSKSVSLARLSIDNTPHDNFANQRRRRRPHDDPHPVFALSHRLLAYASPSPFASPQHVPPSAKSNHRLSSSSPVNSNHSSSLPSSPFGLGLGSGYSMNLGKVTNMTQADLGHAALKVGETVLGGMKLLGGMAYGAARSRVGGGSRGSGDVGRSSRGGDSLVSGGLGERFVSRSAPDTVPVVGTEDDGVVAQRLRERRLSNTSSASGYHATTVAPFTKSSTASSSGYYVTVVDLSPLVASPGVSGKRNANAEANVVLPIVIDEFMSSRSQAIAGLQFSADGMNLAVIQRDGYVLKTFKIRPIASVVLSSHIFGGSRTDGRDNDEMEKRKRWSGHLHHHHPTSSSVQLYNLHRGRTSAVVEGADWSKDGRWLAIGTRKRTVHVFPVNPYGGQVDIASHLEGRVRNVDIIEHPLTDLSPLIRLRGTKQNSTADHLNAPLAFTFISPLDLLESTRLRPQQQTPSSRTTSSPTISPRHKPAQSQQQQYQDILLFDPANGVLSLRRLTLDKQLIREGMAAASVQALGVTSISLPGMGGAGKLAASPSKSGASGHKPSPVVDPPLMELVAKESIVATWDLQRRTDWAEIKQPIVNSHVKRQAGSLGGDWLAEAELTTCSNSHHVLPRSIYLSHQFSFHTLGEDYHALIRRHQFDICGENIQVRKQVEISVYSSGVQGNSTSAAFVEGFSAPRDIRRLSSSFDEPIASAISGSFDNSNLPIILPMYPNGVPGSKSFRNSIPIRTMAGIGDGVSEGLGRIRREMHRARPPQLLPHSDGSISGPVALEFDEEDEDFLVRDVVEEDDGSGGLLLPVATTTRHRDEHPPGNTRLRRSSQHHLPIPLVVDDGSDVVGTVDEEIWSGGGWDQQDELAIDEAEQFDDISKVGYLDEEEPGRPALVMPVLSSKRKGRQRRK